MAPTRDAHDTSVDAIISAVEELANRLRKKEGLQQTERRNLHRQMESPGKDRTGHRTAGGGPEMQT